MDVDTSIPRSRRAILTASLGALGGFLAGALGRPIDTRAAAGSPLILGQANNSGTSQTTLQNAGTGAAFTLKTTNPIEGAAGLFGWSSSTGGDATRGVYGRADGPNSYGVQARNQSSVKGSGAALTATAVNNTAIHATVGGVETDGGIYAVHGIHNNQAGVALLGEAHGTAGGGTGVWGASGQFGTGVLGTSDEGVGVHGKDTGTGFAEPGTGVLGEAKVGDGVVGRSEAGAGVRGEGTAAGDGVVGTAVSGWAGHFDPDARVEQDFEVGGNASVAGSLSKGGGSFKIDHPLAPATKYLQHSFVESPDMKNVYDGLVALDAKGEATVKLPAYFETLNRDLRYQLTSLGEPAPDLHIKREVTNGTFTIAGGKAGQHVSWQVTGVRQDPWAEAHRIVVEEAKPAADRGLYLHPDLYGQPEEKAVDYRNRTRGVPAAG